MNATEHCLSVVLPDRKSWATVYAELTKARLTSLVLLTTAAGYYVGAGAALDGWTLFYTLLGTALLAGGAAALNQRIEWRSDALMTRTCDRPLPTRQLQPATALVFGGVCCVTGTFVLAFGASGWAALVGALTALIYLGAYTPLKKLTWLNTLVGAVPGALPPLIGWAAARHDLSAEGWILFAVQFFWQIPHFLAIAWLYRDDYARAGFAMLPAFDPDGHATANVAALGAGGVLLASLLPTAAGWVGTGYLLWALVLGGFFLGCALGFRRRTTMANARRLFVASLLYLPLLLAVLVATKGRP